MSDDRPRRPPTTGPTGHPRRLDQPPENLLGLLYGPLHLLRCAWDLRRLSRPHPPAARFLRADNEAKRRA